MALVHSYARFSMKKQERGDSLRRQVEASNAWIERNGHTLSNLVLHDTGVSAFRGKNRTIGALSRFLEAIELGRVQPGDILLVENLDRLSREGVDAATELFRSIIRKGVDIVCLRPTESMYTRDALNDPMQITLVLWHFHLAWLESQKKSERLHAVWNQKRKRMEKGEVIPVRCPDWLDYNPETQMFVANAGANAIRFIFEQTALGVGQRVLLKELQARFPPIGRSGVWNTSYLAKLLTSRAVLGERQNYEFTEDRKRVPSGKPIPGYFPAIITPELWDKAEIVKSARKPQRGPCGKFVSLVTGLCVNAHDGHSMHLQTSTYPSGKKQRRLVSYGHISKVPGSDPVGVDYDQFENVFLKYLSEVKPSDLESKVTLTELESKRTELASVSNRLDALRAQLEDTSGGDVAEVLAAIKGLKARQAKIEEEIRGIQAEMRADVPLTQSHELLAALATSSEPHTLRLRLRSAIAELVKEIRIKPERHFGRVYCMALVRFHQGYEKQINFGPGFEGGSFKPMGDSDLAIDFTDPKACRKTKIFRGHATLLREPAKPPKATAIPGTVGPCAKHYLAIVASRMARDSFRIVPPKVQRFVSYHGAEKPLRTIDARSWELWVRSLKLEIREGTLKKNTARVIHGRSREFVLWLMAEGLIDRFDLSQSGEKALA